MQHGPARSTIRRCRPSLSGAYLAGMRAIEGSSPKTKHDPVCICRSPPEWPLNVDQAFAGTSTGASFPDVTLTVFEDKFSTIRSESLPELAVSLHGVGCASGIVVGFHRSAISLAIAGRMAPNFAATSLNGR